MGTSNGTKCASCGESSFDYRKGPSITCQKCHVGGSHGICTKCKCQRCTNCGSNYLK
jgi:hypothetical protein